MKVSNREVIYKYPIQITDGFELQLPQGARVLTVQVQNDMPYIWAVVNPENEDTPRGFRLAGTGHQLNPMGFSEMDYVGTFQLAEGELVYHLFEVAF